MWWDTNVGGQNGERMLPRNFGIQPQLHRMVTQKTTNGLLM
jgi:hypothetical protein